MEFLRTDLAASMAMARSAEAHLNSQSREAAQDSIARAEAGYQTISRLYSDPKHAHYFDAEQCKELEAGLQQLRKKLDELKAALG